MNSISLVHPEETLTVPIVQAMTKCSLFQNNPTLLVSPYRVESSVSLSIFREFVSALKGKPLKIADTNFTELDRLCEEFGFDELSSKLSQFRPFLGLKASEDSDTRERMAALEYKTEQHDFIIAMLQCKIAQLSIDFEGLSGEVSALRSVAVEMQPLFEEISTQQRQIVQKMGDLVVGQLSTELNELRREFSALKAQIPVMSPTVTPSQNHPPSPSPAAVFHSPPKPAIPSFDSVIISDFPEILAELQGKQFCLLLRGNRDGFTAKEFHGRCDGHANTLTVILDTKGNIFGGFTPLKWESPRKGEFKSDDSLKGFVFTLKNPHNLPAQRFSLKAERKNEAILCASGWGSCFGDDICISDKCNENTMSYTYNFGFCYTNDTGLDKKIVLTGSQRFKVDEIEVFEITE
jgi:hypothetical protein